MILVKDTARPPHATFWEKEEFPKYTRVKISTADKQQDGSTTYSSWYTSFVGKAHEKAKTLKQRDYIVLKSFKISNEVHKSNKDGKNKLYFKFTVFDFDVLPPFDERQQSGNAQQEPVQEHGSEAQAGEPDNDEGLPF